MGNDQGNGHFFLFPTSITSSIGASDSIKTAIQSKPIKHFCLRLRRCLWCRACALFLVNKFPVKSSQTHHPFLWNFKPETKEKQKKKLTLNVTLTITLTIFETWRLRASESNAKLVWALPSGSRLDHRSLSTAKNGFSRSEVFSDDGITWRRQVQKYKGYRLGSVLTKDIELGLLQSPTDLYHRQGFFSVFLSKTSLRAMAEQGHNSARTFKRWFSWFSF